MHCLKPRIRRSIATLTPAQITTLRNGVSAMKSLAATDPTSWIYQANIHGTLDPPGPTAWNSCQHYTHFFLSWHRMYLYFFERILRKASGDPNFNLPYWNYSDPLQRPLPLPFRSPANATNPLWVNERAPGINSGAQLPNSAVGFSIAFSYFNFSTPTNTTLSFSRQLEGTPHGAVHGGIGGSTGFMSSFEFAARDPIFWLHHGNIDRLWNRWLQQGGGRTNPTGNSTWMNTKFTFFNENGTQVQMSGSQVVSTAGNLCYRYDDDPPVSPWATRIAVRRGRPELVAASSAAVELEASPVRLTLPVPEANRGKLSRVFTEVPEAQMVLNLDEVSFEKFPGIHYEVYVNLPEGEEADPDSIHYVGNLQFFGLKPHAGHEEKGPGPQSFDITANVRALKEVERWTEGSVAVTLVPRGLTGADQKPLEARPASKIRVGKISLTME
ncbi:MAG TPA: tyrosinase family protein [Thermoanaerobaculia bacterium]|nr:tyrosinase family protein [Thermoanaerobaculia bacterium]